MRTLAERGLLRAGVDVDEATDVLLMLAGPDTYLAFVRERNWSHDRFVIWAGAALAELLLATPTGRPATDVSGRCEGMVAVRERREPNAGRSTRSTLRVAARCDPEPRDR